MSFSINTNITSLQAQNYLNVNSAFQGKTINRVTSGLRIVQSGDDAAGLAIANGLRSDQAVLSQGIRNANDGLSTLQTIDGGMNNISTLLDRARTLATQSASGTFDDSKRGVLNTEFQGVLAEIDRQSQAIGLNTNGQFAKSLSVFIGGGKGADGTAAVVNGSVGLDLSRSTVDAKSLGLKGVQASGNSAVDLSAGHDTSVDKLLLNQTNKDSESAAGYTDFTFTGPGFGDASKVKVSVNLNGVTNTDTLVSAINTAIQNAGNGATASATAFKNAGVTAMKVTDSTGEHLAFTSGSSAFQVQAGDRMANALLGNLSGTTGASLATTVTGSAATASLTSTAAAAETINLRIQGAGMTADKDLSIGVNQGDLVSGALDKLTSAVANDADLKAAGISVARDSGTGKLVFTNTKGEQFTALATGDTANLFGLGSFKMGGALGDKIDYSQITGAANYDPAAATTGGTAVLEFSLNGAASSAAADKISVDLASGDATAAKVTGTGTSASYAITTGTNDQLAIAVDGTVHNITLGAAGSGAAATAATTTLPTDLTDGLDITAGTAASAASYTGTANRNAAVTIDGTNDKLTLSVDGLVKTITLTHQDADADAIAADINTKFGSNIASVDSTTTPGSKFVKLASTTTGTGSTLSIDSSSTAAAVIGMAGNVNVTGDAGGVGANNKLVIAVDGGVAKTITLTSGTGRTADQIMADINGQFAGLATVDTTTTEGESHLVLTSGTTGTGSHITIDFAASNAATDLGLAADVDTAGTAAGAGGTVGSIADTIQTALGASAVVTVGTNNAISIEAANKGTGHSIQILAGTANGTVGLTEGNVYTGTNRSGADLASALNDAFSTKADLQNSGLSATYTANKISIISANDTNFRLNTYSGGTPTAASLIGTKSVVAGGNFNLTGAIGLSIAADGGDAVAVTLTSGNMTAQAVVDAINGTTGIGVTASKVTDNGRDFIRLVSTTTGASSSITLTGTSLAVLGLSASANGSAGDIGFGTVGATFAGNTASAAPTTSPSVMSGGAYQTGALAFGAIKFGGDSQVVTVTANDSSGIQQSQDITLSNNASIRNARNIDETVNAINSALQQSNVAVLQNVVAMKVDDAGTEKIQFASGNGAFKISIGATSNGGGFASPGTVTATQEGTGSTASIGDQTSAEKAVTALANAVSQLGSAQAVVGRGQNQFSYAVNLAQSQLTNLAAAESRIRDADLASEAANLTKAQILVQAGVAALAQANTAPQQILTLLRG